MRTYNVQNLRSPKARTGRLAKKYTQAELEDAREQTYDRLCVAVDRVVKATGASTRQIGVAMGRDLTRILPSVLAGNDCHMKTLIDLATVTGHKVVVSFEPR